MTPTEQRKRAQLERTDNELEQRKRSRLERVTEVVESDNASLPSKDTSSPPEDRDAPKGFICPLTLEIMYDPVLDPEGNTYERRAITEWLRHKRNSPVSRQPLNEKMLIPNNALRETIHEIMGTDWSDRQVREHPPAGLPLRGLSFRAKIDCYLQSISQEISGVSLCLNEHGHCIFQYENIVIVLYVPESVGVFCFYTRELVPTVTDSMKDLILELNFLQGKSVYDSARNSSRIPSRYQWIPTLTHFTYALFFSRRNTGWLFIDHA
jgi:hypothetical protein